MNCCHLLPIIRVNCQPSFVQQNPCCWRRHRLLCWRLGQTLLPPAGLPGHHIWRWMTFTGPTLRLSCQRSTTGRSTARPSRSPSPSLPLTKAPTCCCVAARRIPILSDTTWADVSTGSFWAKAVSALLMQVILWIHCWALCLFNFLTQQMIMNDFNSSY